MGAEANASSHSSPPSDAEGVSEDGLEWATQEGMMKRCIAWAPVLVLPAVLLLVADVSAQQPKSGGTLRVAWEQDVTGFDPHWTPGLQVTYIAGNLFNNLVTIDQDLNSIPELAESWEAQDNGKA